jgi:hypothetical protein
LNVKSAIFPLSSSPSAAKLSFYQNRQRGDFGAFLYNSCPRKK